MYLETKLSKMPYAQACVILKNGEKFLKSYETIVAKIDNDGWLEIFGLYSATTKRHISAFVEEYAKISYKTAKDLYTWDKRYNIYTGVIE